MPRTKGARRGRPANVVSERERTGRATLTVYVAAYMVSCHRSSGAACFLCPGSTWRVTRTPSSRGAPRSRARRTSPRGAASRGRTQGAVGASADARGRRESWCGDAGGRRTGGGGGGRGLTPHPALSAGVPAIVPRGDVAFVRKAHEQSEPGAAERRRQPCGVVHRPRHERHVVPEAAVGHEVVQVRMTGKATSYAHPSRDAALVPACDAPQTYASRRRA